MELKEAQKRVKEMTGSLEHPRLASFIALTEEVGEIANEIMKREIYEEKTDNAAIKAEIADAMFSLMELANVYGADLDAEFSKKLETLAPRFEGWKKTFGNKMPDKRKKLD